MCTFIEMDDKEIVKFLNGSGTAEMGSNTEKYISKTILDSILSKHNFAELLKRWNIDSKQRFIYILNEVLKNEVPNDVCKDFFLHEIVSKMMSLENEVQIRDNLVEASFMLCSLVKVTDLSLKEYELFLKEVYSKYIPAISQLRDSNYANWHKLWIFLVKFFARKIHESMDLTNRLLRIVEYAFRNSSFEQRLRGYDCWKELIDNASLDHTHMCTPKQIKLLVTPLRAKFSKQEVVICKRFDVFVHLLQKLEQKAVLCLPDFLEFCFGTIESKDNSKSGQAKNVPQIWERIAKVLVSVLGHSHAKNVGCISEEIIFEMPIVNAENIQNFYKVIINSVAECCCLFKDNNLKNKRDEVVRCLWKSVFNLITSIPESDRIKCASVVTDILDNYIRQSRDLPYAKELISLILFSLMTLEQEKLHDFVPLMLKQMVTMLLITETRSDNVSNYIKQAISHTFSKVLLEENKMQMIRTMLDCLLIQNEGDQNLSNYTKVWILVANEVASDCDPKKLAEFSKFDEFFRWPSLNLHRLDEVDRKQLILNWMKLYRKLTLDSETKKMEVMGDMEKSFKNNPLLSSNVSSLLNVVSQFETKFSKDFIVKLMEVVSSVLQLPNLSTEDENKLSSLVMQYFEPSLDCYKREDLDEMIKTICTCIEHILRIHSGVKLIDPLVNFIKNLPQNAKDHFSKHLKDLSSDLYKKETDLNSYKAKEIYKLLSVFTDEKRTFIVAGRSARIANMGKNSPTSPHRTSKTPTLRLFGKDLETMSPLKVKGSQLDNTPTSRKKKCANTIDLKHKTIKSVNEENSSDFVAINTEVKLQPEKLSEHQKEIMKKRREDIPALYQDLTQSMSQDIFSSKENAKISEENDPKTIVSRETAGNYQSEGDLFSEPSKEPDNDIREDGRVPVDDKSVENPTTEESFRDADKKLEEPTPNSEIEDSDPKMTPTGEFLGYSIKLPTHRKSLPQRIEDEDPVTRKKRREIERLKMDIVGADKFYESPSRTRVKKAPKKLAEFQNKKDKKENEATTDESGDSKKNRGKPAKSSEETKNEEIPPVPESPRKKRGRSKEKKKLEQESQPSVPEDTVGNEALTDSTKTARGRSKRKKIHNLAVTVTEDQKAQEPPAKGGGTNDDPDETQIREESGEKEISTKLLESAGSEKKSARTRKNKKNETNPNETPKNVPNLNETPKNVKPEKNLKKNLLLNLAEQNSQENRGGKGKLTDEHNEDVIESSQEPFDEVVPLLNSSKKRTSLKPEETKQPEDIVIIEGYKQLHDRIELVNEESKPEDACNSQDSTLTQNSSLNTNDTLDTFVLKAVEEDSKISPEPPKKPLLTESQLVVCRMDTLSVCGTKDTMDFEDLGVLNSEENKVGLDELAEDVPGTPSTETAPSISSASPCTPIKTRSIPGSPITADTPNRTHEFLDDTMDISPITSRSNSEEEIMSDVVPVAESIQVDFEKLEKLPKMVEEPIVAPTEGKPEAEEKDDTFEDGSSDGSDNVDASSEAEMTPLEAAENVQEAFDFQEPSCLGDDNPIQNGQVSTTINIISSRASKDSPAIQERSSKLQNLIHAISNKPFMKRKVGATSSPSTMRLKKLFVNMGPKQPAHTEVMENLNENDILTFSREIPSPLAVPRSSILKRKFSDSSDGEGLSPCPKRKRVNFSDPCLTSKKIFIIDDYQPSLEAKRLFDAAPERKSTDEHLKDIFDFPDESSGSEFLTETDSDLAETEPSLTVVNPMVLLKNKSIFPKLVECKDDVLVIVKRITSPMFVPALMNKLKGKNVKTVGDLARLSESEVNRFPFKVPVVANVLKALENYHKKKGGGGDARNDEKQEEEKRNGDVEMPKLDVKLELKVLMKRAQRERVPIDELARILLPHIEPTKLYPLLKHYCPPLVLDSLEEKDYNAIFRTIIDTKGISEILKRAHVTFYNDQKEHDFYQDIADYVKYTVPLEKFFRGRTIEDLEVGIEESIKNKVFQREDVIENCLLPLVESPKDLNNYLDTLSNETFDEIVVDRLKRDPEAFFKRIIKHCRPEDAKTVCETLWCQQPSTSAGIVESLGRKLEVQSEKERTESLVEIVKFAGEKLDVKSLAGLFGGLMKRITDALE